MLRTRALKIVLLAATAVAIVPPLPWVCDDGACIDDLETSDMVAALAHKRVEIVRPGAWTLSGQ